jgi:hypothetical protein
MKHLLLVLISVLVVTAIVYAKVCISDASEVVADQHCPPLGPPEGRIVTVATEAELWDAVNEGVPYTTILVADGSYQLGQNGYYLWLDTPNVTLRSQSGDREAVVLDDAYSGSEIVTVAASGVTIADLTIKRAGTHPIHVVSSDSGDTRGTLVYNVTIVDPGQQGIKINPHTAQVHFPDAGEIACSRIELTAVGRAAVVDINGSCYTGGVDGHQARDWIIRDNEIDGFWCSSGLSEHAIHMWRGSRDTLVERNILRDNARGVGFGLATSGQARTYADSPCPAAGDGYVDHYGGLVRNNFVFASSTALFGSEYGFDCGICLWQACGARAVHNTVASTQAPFSSIEWRFENSDVDIINNLVTHNLNDRGGTSRVEGNLEGGLLSLFVDGPGGDLHLDSGAVAAIDMGVPVGDGLCDEDIDGDARPAGLAPDIGADEAVTPRPDAVTDLRASRVVTSAGSLVAYLDWTAPVDAATTTLRYGDTLITEASWASAAVLIDALPGVVEAYTATIPYDRGTVFFALKSQNAAADWSDLSNNAFWPVEQLWLPAIPK